MIDADRFAKYQRHRGYQGSRIRQYSSDPALWVAEIYTLLGRGYKKGWRALRDEKEQYRTFATAELAYTALVAQLSAWQKELEEGDQICKQEQKPPGRLYPFCYRSFHDETEEALVSLLRTYGSRVIWLLDIRFDPDGSSDGYQGSWLKQAHASQYRHAKGLGLVKQQLYHPDSAVRKMLSLVQRGESFVLFSDSVEHVQLVETLVREEAKKQRIPLEDPYGLHAGDLCLWRKQGTSVEVILHHRTADVYVFLASSLGKGPSNEYVDVGDLVLVEAGLYRCEKCARGEVMVAWRQMPQQKLCKHCFWVWELENEDE